LLLTTATITGNFSVILSRTRRVVPDDCAMAVPADRAGPDTVIERQQNSAAIGRG
jgi:hypothetical protein